VGEGLGLAEGLAPGEADGDADGEGAGVGVGSGGHAFVPGVISKTARTPRTMTSFWS